jgi:hypothetical protein
VGRGVCIYVNAKMILVETIPGIWREEEIKESAMWRT